MKPTGGTDRIMINDESDRLPDMPRKLTRCTRMTRANPFRSSPLTKPESICVTKELSQR